ncbi:MAG: DUF721 domain-containing protein [Nitrospirae bacterium]|nr:DUF721 domain-containing protein [Nitrospirota bacterium]
MGFGPFNSVHSVIQDLARSHGFEVRMWEYRLRMEWATLVGQPLATYTLPDKLRFRKLSIVVGNSVWLQQLMFIKPALLEKIQSFCHPDLVTDIHFRIGVIPSPLPEDSFSPLTQADSPSALPLEAQHTISQATAQVSDASLRESLATVMAKALTS